MELNLFWPWQLTLSLQPVDAYGYVSFRETPEIVFFLSVASSFEPPE